MKRRRASPVEGIWRDLVMALRGFGRSPGFMAVAVLTIALGIGVNTAVFALVNATMLRPLPFAEPDRLVTVFQREAGAEGGSRPIPWSYPEYAALRRSLTSLAHLSAYYSTDANLAGAGAEPVRVGMEIVSSDYLPLLGVPMALGRPFQPEEDSVPGEHPVAILGHRLWSSTFGSDPGVLGGSIVLNGVSHTVVGVLPAGFRGLSGEGEVWITHAMAPAVYYPEHLTIEQRFLGVVGRVREGRSVQDARAELAAVGGAALAGAHPGSEAEGGGRVPALLPLEDARRDPASVRAHFVLAGAVFFVLLIAAVNLSGLLLARSVGRTREMAVRSAIGASRARLVRQVLVEGALLGTLGGALGLLLASWSMQLLALSAPDRLGGAGPRFMRLSSFSAPEMDWRILLFGAVAALATGLLTALLPALRATRGDLVVALKTGARGSTAGVGSLRRPTMLSGIAVAQVALALVLLVGAGALLEGFHRLRSVDTGMDASGVVVFRLTPPEGRYGGPAAAALHEEVLARVSALPGVSAATIGRCLPGTGCSSSQLFITDRGEERSDPPIVRRHYVGPDHFRTLGIPLIRGRGLSPDDRAGAPRVAVVNRTAAERFWPGEDPIGKRVYFGSGGGFASPDSLTEIVGVVGDVRYGAPGADMGADFYTSYLQHVLPATLVMVRTAGEPLALVPALRRAVAAVDPELPVHDVRTVPDFRAEALSEERFATRALGGFAALGLLLAALGVYGVMAYSVAQRRRELGIRLALGAAPADLLRFVVRQGVVLTGVGLVLGAAGSLVLSPALPALVQGVARFDPAITLAAAALLLLVAGVTCYLPARGAARVDPAEAFAAE